MSSEYEELGLPRHWAEDFWSISTRGVLRGLHYQGPPHEHSKTVTCLEGEIFDVVVDLRVDSPTYGMHQTIRLDSGDPAVLVMPAGVAHGFQVITNTALVYYKTSSLHFPPADGGILWNSCGIEWPLEPILSPRDASFESFHSYASCPVF
jgi:dTDP-4-dehydrorhamnose 3,5-epimerase